jgi:competence ComEA-like helix-hairpin-helix protein
MSAAERRALVLLISLGLLGQGVRWWLTRPGEAAGAVELLSVLPGRPPLPHRDSALALARPLAEGETIDPDRAAPLELARLPRVGLALAKRIVADRQAHGPFGGVGGLDRVPGIGPGLLREIGPHLSFSGVGAVNGTGLAPAPAGDLISPPSGAGLAPLNLNRATAVELERLPGIGPTLARRIVADREARGPFASVPAIARVAGVGPALVARLGDRVVAP